MSEGRLSPMPRHPYPAGMLRSQSAAEVLFAGPGEMFERCRQFDWGSTPLGPVEGWSQSLRTMATAVLHSRNPMLLFWGPELTQFYNDAFRPSLGPADGPAPRHPRALGMSARDFWVDVWSVVGPQIEGVMDRGAAVWFENLYLPIEKGRGVPEPTWWTYSYSPVHDDDGRINGTLVVCLETTAAVQAGAMAEFERNRLRELFRHAPSFMCVLRGRDHVFEMANDNYVRLVGNRDLIGKPAREALPEVVEQGFDRLLDGVLETGEPYIGENVPVDIVGADGTLERRFLTFVYQPITEPDGSRSGVFVQGIDVTENARALEAAEAASQAKSDFLAMMSHELRTPLNAIDGYAELLMLGVHGPLTDDQREDIERIRRSERHLLGLINEVLNYTRLEAGAVQYDTSDVRLDELVASCDALTAPQRSAKRLDYRFDGCPRDLLVRADPDRLRQILLNLVGNAIKFTPEGGSIVVACSADDHFVSVAVTDNGPGIDADRLENIFEPFVQVGPRYTRPSDGVGLGLAISRDLARGMGGELSVRSVPGRGSTFTLTLPRSQN